MKAIYTILLLLCLGKTLAQSPADTVVFTPTYAKATLYTIYTTFGTKHTGYIVEETPDKIVLETKNSHEKLEINKTQIVQNRNKDKKNRYSEEILGSNEHASQYMLSGSAFLFEEGTSVSNNHWLFIQNIDYALSENWAVTVGSLLFYPVSVGAKCSYQLNELNYIGFSGNVMGNIFTTATAGSMFWGYSALARYTHGSSNKNLTISAGLLSLNSNLIDPSASSPYINIPFVSAAYANRFSDRFCLNAEAWVFPQTMVALTGAGFKYLHNEHIAWTLGCYTNIVSENNTLIIDTKSIPIPYISFSRKFN